MVHILELLKIYLIVCIFFFGVLFDFSVYWFLFIFCIFLNIQIDYFFVRVICVFHLLFLRLVFFAYSSFDFSVFFCNDFYTSLVISVFFWSSNFFTFSHSFFSVFPFLAFVRLLYCIFFGVANFIFSNFHLTFRIFKTFLLFYFWLLWFFRLYWISFIFFLIFVFLVSFQRFACSVFCVFACIFQFPPLFIVLFFRYVSNIHRFICIFIHVFIFSFFDFSNIHRLIFRYFFILYFIFSSFLLFFLWCCLFSLIYLSMYLGYLSLTFPIFFSILQFDLFLSILVFFFTLNYTLPGFSGFWKFIGWFLTWFPPPFFLLCCIFWNILWLIITFIYFISSLILPYFSITHLIFIYFFLHFHILEYLLFSLFFSLYLLLFNGFSFFSVIYGLIFSIFFIINCLIFLSFFDYSLFDVIFFWVDILWIFCFLNTF